MSDRYLKVRQERDARLTASREKLRVADENCPLSEDALKICKLAEYHRNLVFHLAEIGPSQTEWSLSELSRIRDQLNIIAKEGFH